MEGWTGGRTIVWTTEESWWVEMYSRTIRNLFRENVVVVWMNGIRVTIHKKECQPVGRLSFTLHVDLYYVKWWYIQSTMGNLSFCVVDHLWWNLPWEVIILKVLFLLERIVSPLSMQIRWSFLLYLIDIICKNAHRFGNRYLSLF